MYSVWENVLAEIEQKISAANFSTWFRNTSLISTEDGNILIGVNNSFYIKQLRSKFLNYITDALIKNGVEVKNIDFEVKGAKSKIQPREVLLKPVQIKEKTKTLKSSLSKDHSFNNGLNNKYSFFLPFNLLLFIWAKEIIFFKT